MLYVTTRNNRDAFTVQRVMRENRCEEGGLYLPFRAPVFSREEISQLSGKSVNQCIADILNGLFHTRLTSWDIDFCSGRYPVRLQPLGHRVTMAESWHNPDWNYDRMVNSLSFCLSQENGIPSDWVRIAVRVAVLFAIFGELQRSGIETADISVVSGDFSAPVSAWYARQWGLPIGNIICCCNENNNIWDLFCHGHLRTDALSVPTSIPEADVALPEGLERLIYECGGILEVERYLDACRRGMTYCPEDPVLGKLRKGMYVSVASSQRVERTIPSVYRTHNYLLSLPSALAYAGLLDYRAQTGATRHAFVLAEKSPICDGDKVAKALGIPLEELRNHI